MFAAYLICAVLFVLAVIYVAVFAYESFLEKRNPILLTLNHDKRFCEIKNIYSHKMFDIKRGNI